MNGGSGSAQALSCAESGPGRSTCGANDESCCTSLMVTGGPFFRTYTNSGDDVTGKADAATVSSYRLDKYEVTLGRFRKYVEYLENGGSPPAAGSGKHAHLNAGQGLTDSGNAGTFETGWDASWNSKIPSGTGATEIWKAGLTSQGAIAGSGCQIYGTWTDTVGENEELPITCTNWYESYAFCIWDGGFLPSEAEWKYAAAGGDEYRRFPWGSMNPGSENQYAIYDCCYPSGECNATSGRDTCTGVVNASPVGFAALGAGRYGQLDLSGGVFEWTLDRFTNRYVSPCEDCAYLTGSGTNRVLPGGGFHTPLTPILLSSNRQSVSWDADFRGDYAVGFRCARSP